jgi:transcriptional regulator with GAF, ATPase, and Fis domain
MVGNEDVVRSTLVELSHDFANGDTSVENALARVTGAAVELIEGVDHADVLLIDGSKYRSVAATSPVPVRLDTAQCELQQGPCLEAATADAVIRSTDVLHDSRWPKLGSVAAEFGIRSMLCYQLYTDARGSGALNMFGNRTEPFDMDAEAIGAMLATHAAAILVAARRQNQFSSALASRDIIGQAKGIIMERFSIDAVQAFELLRRLSQTSNVPLRDIAQQFVNQTVAEHPKAVAK